jgi:hypothetical protein
MRQEPGNSSVNIDFVAAVTPTTLVLCRDNVLREFGSMVLPVVKEGIPKRALYQDGRPFTTGSWPTFVRLSEAFAEYTQKTWP